MWAGPKGPELPDDLDMGPHIYAYCPDHVHNAPYVNVLVDQENIYTFKVQTVRELIVLLHRLCIGCMMFKRTCRCPKYHPHLNGVWMVETKELERPRNKLVHYAKDKEFLFATFTCGGGNITPYVPKTLLTTDVDEVQGLADCTLTDGISNTALKLFEDIMTLVYQFRNARTVNDSSVAIAAFVRSVTGNSSIASFSQMQGVINNFVFKKCMDTMIWLRQQYNYRMQNGPSWDERFSALWDDYNSVKNSTFVDKLFSVINTVVGKVVLYHIGIKYDDEFFKKMEEEQIRPKMKDCVTFTEAIVSLIVFLTKQGRQYLITGNLKTFFLDGNSINEWLTRCKRIRSEYEFFDNPEAANIDIHAFLKDLSECIAEGRSFVNAFRKNSLEYRLANSTLIEMINLEKRYLVVESSLAMREAPFGILLYGSPGIGKSSVVNIICEFFAQRYNLDPSPQYRFNHCSEDEYFTNFKSYMHTIILDDVAQHKPNRVQGIDPSISTLIKIFNSMPFSPPQAALEDKGKTPMLVKLGIVTTNVLDLHVPHYFSKPFAVYRRLPFNIEPVVQSRFRKEGTLCLDPDKTDGSNDYWHFIVRTPFENSQTYTTCDEFVSIAELLTFLGDKMDSHARNERIMIKNSNDMMRPAPCKYCWLDMDECCCIANAVNPEVQNNVEHDHVNLNDDIDTPWRYIFDPKCEAPRNLSRRQAKRYVDQYIATIGGDRWDVTNYVYIYLGPMLKAGWIDDDIKRDFKAYLVWIDETKECDRFGDFMGNMHMYNCGNFGLTGHLRAKLFSYFCYCYYQFYWFGNLINRLLAYSWFKRTFKSVFGCLFDSNENRRAFLYRAADVYDQKIGGSHPLIKALAAVGIFTIIARLFYQFQSYKAQPVFPPGKEEEANEMRERIREQCEKEKNLVIAKYEAKLKKVISESNYKEELNTPRTEFDTFTYLEGYGNKLNDVPVQTQGNISSVGSIPTAAVGDEKVNVWNRSERTVTAVDFCDDRATSMETINRTLKRAVVLIDVLEDSGKRHIGRGLIISNTAVCINNHLAPKGCFRMKIYFDKRADNAPFIEFIVDPRQLDRKVCRDLCFIKTLSVPPNFSNRLSRNFAKSSFDGTFNGFLLIRDDDDGRLQRLEVKKIVKTFFCQEVDELKFSTQSFRGIPEYPTQKGHCGAPLFMETGYGPICVGIHFLYSPQKNFCYATSIVVEDLEEYQEENEVQSGVIPHHFEFREDVEKSYVDYHPTTGFFYHGELDMHRTRPKTRVVKTEIAEAVFAQCHEYGMNIKDKYSKPLMHNWIPQQIALADFIKRTTGINEVNLIKCCDVLFRDIVKNLPPSEIKLIHPVPVEVAINGYPAMAYVDPIKRSTSMGFPYRTTKRKYLVPCEGVWPDGVTFTPEILAGIQSLYDKYCSGTRAYCVFSSNNKDEVVSKKKFESGKTRVFFSCPYDMLVVLRMMFLGFTRVVQRNWDVFHCVIGVNCHSTQWHNIAIKMQSIGSNFIAGDFKGFDKGFMVSMMRHGFRIIRRLCVLSGNFSEEHLRVLDCLEADLTTPTVEYFGMLITLLGGEVSGHQLTTVFNCFMSCLYIMYAYSTIYDVEDFFEYVIIYTLGDDHILSVSPLRPKFTHTYISEVLEAAGVGYTMADKDAESVPYIPFSEVTFLKRNFIYNSDLGFYVGPLDVDSIYKMLTYHVVSKSVSEEEALAQAMCSAVTESFYHGKLFFNNMVSFLNKVEKSESLKLYMGDYPFPTYEQLIDRFIASSNLQVEALDKGLNQNVSLIDSHCTSPPLVLQGDVRMGHRSKLARAFPEVRFYGNRQLVGKEVHKRIRSESIYSVENQGLASKTNNNNESLASGSTNEALNIKADTPDVSTSDTTQENVHFINEEHTGYQDFTNGLDPSAREVVSGNLSMGNYFKRPQRIFEYTWNIGTSPGSLTEFNPWDLYFNTPAIKNKLNNFAFFRGDLHLKFVINASPFLYGSIACFYQPLSVTTDRLGPSSYAPGQQVLVSQRNGVWLDPQSTSSQELKIPFLHPNHFCETKLRDNLKRMGVLSIWEFATLTSANGVVSGGVSIQVYAWSDNIEVLGNTNGLILQGKTEYGIVSGPASTVMNVAQKLTTIPAIAPYARATSVVASAIGSVASFFGYTNVPVIDDVKPYKPSAFHTLASAHISEPINKLSLQPKQETAVGSHFGDPGTDSLVIKNFCQRESFLCGTEWTTVQTDGTILFTSFVKPGLNQRSPGGFPASFPVHFHTPMSFASTFFQYWVGDIVFRFKVVKSKYHRGRINIAWDPAATNLSAMPDVGEATIMNIVLDLDITDEVEVRVPYQQAMPFLKTQTITQNDGKDCWSNGPTPSFASSQSNGVIQLRVLNNLTAPESTSSVDILIFVRAADNLQFAAPSNMDNNPSLFEVQSKVIEIAPKTGEYDMLFQECFGERIVSFRELLHRSSRTCSLVCANVGGTGPNMCHFPILRLPRMYGYMINGWDDMQGIISGASAKGNFVNNHIVNYIVSCFIGFKGSTNWHFNAIDNNTGRPVKAVSFVRRAGGADTTLGPYSTVWDQGDPTAKYNRYLSADLNNSYSSGASGMALTNQQTQAGLSVNLPYYYPKKFREANPTTVSNSTGGTTYTPVEDDVFVLTVQGTATSTTYEAMVWVDAYFGTGPDFDVVYFLNVPPVYTVGTIPFKP